MELTKQLREMSPAEKAALTTGKNDWNTVPVERLKIGSVWMSDGPHGLRIPGDPDENGIRHDMPGDSMPAEALMAASFDRDLLYRLGEELGEQCLGRKVDMLLGPGINIKRSPLCGRNFEYFSEDPLVSGEMGKAYVSGLQSKGIGACVKHYLCNNQETRRSLSSSQVDERTLREIYMPAFENVVKNAHPWGVMASYNLINGTHATEHRHFLKEVLRDEWGYDGIVISDWGATHDRAKAVDAGTDLTMPCDSMHNHEITEAIAEGRMEEASLDEAVTNMLRFIGRCKSVRKDGEYDAKRAYDFSREAASEGAVLLKNEGPLLPLEEGKKILIMGEFAAEPRIQGGGSSNVIPSQLVTPCDAFLRNKNVTYVKGCSGETTDAALLEEAKTAAINADAVVIFAGMLPLMEQEGIDREHIDLPESHNTLISTVSSVQPETVVVLLNGSAVAMPWIDEVRSVVEMYYPGEACGDVAYDILFGRVNPSGRLAESFPLRAEDNPSYLFFPGERARTEYREGVYVGYRYYESVKKPVLFPFGWGLSYTTFSYENLVLSADEIAAEDTVSVSVDVTNTGKAAGKEVVQLYVGVKKCEMPRPVKELRAFEKIFLSPGEKKTVTFKLDKSAFSYWNDEAHCRHMAGGIFEIQIGRNCRDVICAKEIRANEEQIDLKITYDMESLVGDLVKHPYGEKWFMEHAPEIFACISKSPFAQQGETDTKDYAAMSKEEILDMAGILLGQPLTILSVFTPGMQDFEWVELINRLNA